MNRKRKQVPMMFWHMAEFKNGYSIYQEPIRRTYTKILKGVFKQLITTDENDLLNEYFYIIIVVLLFLDKIKKEPSYFNIFKEDLKYCQSKGFLYDDKMFIYITKYDIMFIDTYNIHKPNCTYCKADKRKENNSKKKLQRCSGCKCVRYCCKECQINDWKNHKKICMKLKLQLSTYIKEKTGNCFCCYYYNNFNKNLK